MTETKKMSMGVLLGAVLLLLLLGASAGEEERGQALAEAHQAQAVLGEVASRQIREVKERGAKKNKKSLKKRKGSKAKKESRKKLKGRRGKKMRGNRRGLKTKNRRKKSGKRNRNKSVNSKGASKSKRRNKKGTKTEKKNKRNKSKNKKKKGFKTQKKNGRNKGKMNKNGRNTKKNKKQKIAKKNRKGKNKKKNKSRKNGKKARRNKGKNKSRNNGKKARRNKGKNKGRKNGKKARRNKGKNKSRKNGKKARRNKKSKTRQNSSCHNITCLNNLLQVLKIDKDTVQNFMQQKKRIDKKLSLAASKKGKSNVTSKAQATLATSLGGTGALKNNCPMCRGRYNVTDGDKGAAMYNNITKCDNLIKTACNISMKASEKSQLGKCNKVMEDFR